MKLDTFTTAYIASAFFTEDLDDSGLNTSDITPAALERIKADCAKFQAENFHDIDDEERAGHDFWLTRNRHGAGFWDGDWPEPAAKRLTDAAHAFGECSLMVGDDDAIHHFPA